MEATNKVHRCSDRLQSSCRLGFPVLPPHANPSILLGHGLVGVLHITGQRAKQGGQRTFNSPKRDAQLVCLRRPFSTTGLPSAYPQKWSAHHAIQCLRIPTFSLHCSGVCV